MSSGAGLSISLTGFAHRKGAGHHCSRDKCLQGLQCNSACAFACCYLPLENIYLNYNLLVFAGHSPELYKQLKIQPQSRHQRSCLLHRPASNHHCPVAADRRKLRVVHAPSLHGAVPWFGHQNNLAQASGSLMVTATQRELLREEVRCCLGTRACMGLRGQLFHTKEASSLEITPASHSSPPVSK